MIEKKEEKTDRKKGRPIQQTSYGLKQWEQSYCVSIATGTVLLYVCDLVSLP